MPVIRGSLDSLDEVRFASESDYSSLASEMENAGLRLTWWEVRLKYLADVLHFVFVTFKAGS